MAGKLQFMTINNLQEFLNLHNVQIDKKISDAVANSIKTVSSLRMDTQFTFILKLHQ